jgi:hypothetical protein
MVEADEEKQELSGYDEDDEYVDEYENEEDYYTPSAGVLILMLLLIVSVAAAVGVGSYAAYEKINEDDDINVKPSTAPVAPTPAPVAPTPAPVATTIAPVALSPAPVAATEPLFVCPICAEGNVTNPDGIVCSQALANAEDGNITEAECPSAQAEEFCSCSTSSSRTEASILALLESAVGSEVNREGSSQYLAAQYLLNDDPRFVRLGRRQLQPGDDGLVGPPPTADPPLDDMNPGDVASNGTAPIVDDTNLTINYTDPILLPNVTIDEIFANSTMDNATMEVGPTVDDDFGTDLLTLSDLADEELLSRYLLILLYYQTTNNRKDPWDSECVALEDSADAVNVTGICTWVTPARFSDGSLDKASLPSTQSGPRRWLSSEPECSWAGVTCGVEPFQVESIWLGTWFLPRR